ncbi:MAG: hypothetical protein JWM85_3344 [Acidimicrobiaceae bacterium]|nr:hypothetical protein [Acidimicrobiaceae bacterium]
MFDLESLQLGRTPEEAVIVLNEASRQFLLPVDIDRRLAECVELGLEPEDTMRSLRTFIMSRNEASTSSPLRPTPEAS